MLITTSSHCAGMSMAVKNVKIYVKGFDGAEIPLFALGKFNIVAAIVWVAIGFVIGLLVGIFF
jgi:hypothetical protein